MKNLSNKGMTLVEVVVTVALLSIVSLAVFQSTMFLLRMYGEGKTVYEIKSRMSDKIERGEGDTSSGAVTFKAGSNTVTVNGQYQSLKDESGKNISLVKFKPN